MTLVTAAGQDNVDLRNAQLAFDPRELELGGIEVLDAPQEVLGFVFVKGAGLMDVRARHAPSALVTAAENGEADVVHWLLERGADPHAREPDGLRPLDCAARHGHAAVVDRLLAHDLRLLDLPGMDGRTALLAAVAAQHLPLVRRFLTLGADPARWAADGSRALDLAAQDGHREIAELLLAHDARLLELPGCGGRPALVAAAGAGHAELADLFLQRGADPRRQAHDGTRALDAAARHGYVRVAERLLAHDPGLLDLPGAADHTALMAAAGGGEAALVRLLLSQGADTRARACDGTHALDLACQGGHLGVVEILLAHDPLLLEHPGRGERPALCAAAAGGHRGLVQRLLAAGARARRRTATGSHALDLAAHAGHPAVAEVLLAHDPQLLDLPGRGERTALMAAAAAGQLELVRRLLACGADPRRRQSDGAHALDQAAEAGERAVVLALLAHDHWLLDLPGRGGRTALAAAAGAGHVTLLAELLSRGADPRRRGADGAHALEAAAAQGRGPAVETLLAHDPHLLDHRGWKERTALAAAAAEGHADLVRFLLEKGADPRLRATDGTTALYWAAWNGHQAVLNQLLEFDPRLLDLPVVSPAERLCGLPRWLVPHRPGAHASEGLGVIEILIVARRSEAALGLLRRHRSRINATGIGGMTPLMLSAGTEQHELTQWLLAHGADAAVRDHDGSHALLHAFGQRALSCAQLLITHDPKLAQLAGPGGRTPALVAAQMCAAAQTAAMRRGPEALLALMQ